MIGKESHNSALWDAKQYWFPQFIVSAVTFPNPHTLKYECYCQLSAMQLYSPCHISDRNWQGTGRTFTNITAYF